MPIKFREIQKILREYWYSIDHQKWSHLTYIFNNDSITVPKHRELKVGTAHSILQDIASQQKITVQTIKQKYNIKL